MVYRCVHTQLLSRVLLFVTPWAIAHRAPLPLEFPRQEYWSGLPFSSPGDFPDPGIKPMSPASPTLADRFFTTEPLWMSLWYIDTLSEFLAKASLFFWHFSQFSGQYAHPRRWAEWEEIFLRWVSLWGGKRGIWPEGFPHSYLISQGRRNAWLMILWGGCLQWKCLRG